MPFNGSGVFQRLRLWVADAAGGVKIRADFHDEEDNGFAAGLSNCITKDGQTTITQNIPFNNKRATGLENPVNPQDAATKAYADYIHNNGGEQIGNIRITNATPNITLNGTAVDATGQMQLVGARDGKVRWMLRLGNGEIEGADPAVADEGSNFDIYRANDAGAFIGPVLTFNRTTGLGTVAGDPTVPLGIATKGYVDAWDATKLPLAGGTLSGVLTTAPSGNIAAGGGLSSIQVIGDNTTSGISFHIPSVFAANFGLGQDGNFYMGGWSYGVGVAHRFWTTRDFASFPNDHVTATRLQYAGDPGVGFAAAGGTHEPYPGAVATGWSWTDTGVPLITGVRMRYLQYFTPAAGWVTSGYSV